MCQEKKIETHLQNDMDKCFRKKVMKFQTDNITNESLKFRTCKEQIQIMSMLTCHWN